MAGFRKVVPTCFGTPKMEDFLHPYFSVYHFRLAYAGIIKPLPDKSQWPKVEFGYKLLPPLAKRAVGRQRKNRIPWCLESKGDKSKTKGAWKVQCKTCFQHGHRSSSPKCPMNGPKKRYKWLKFAYFVPTYIVISPDLYLQEESCKARKTLGFRERRC